MTGENEAHDSGLADMYTEEEFHEMDAARAAAVKARQDAEAERVRLRKALDEIKARSGIAHATLRHATYRMPKNDQRDNAETALARLGEINDLARSALAPSTGTDDG